MQLTPEERAFLSRELCYFYRCGKLGLGALLALGFRRKPKPLESRTRLYLALYQNPKQAQAALSHTKAFRRQCAIAWLKHQIRRDTPGRDLSGSPCPVFYEEFLTWAEGQFLEKGNPAPEVQRLFLEICASRAESKFFFPVFSTDAETARWRQRFLRLLHKIDLAQFLSAPIPATFRHYFLSMVISPADCSLSLEQGRLAVYGKGLRLVQEEGAKLTYQSIRIQGDTLVLTGTLEADAFSYLPPPVLTAHTGGKSTAIPLAPASVSYAHSYEPTATAYAFRHVLALKDGETLSLSLALGEVACPMVTYFGKRSPIQPSRPRFTRWQWQVAYQDGAFRLTRQSDIVPAESGVSGRCAAIRQAVYQLDADHTRIWLYCDYHSVGADNGLYQFCHDVEMDDGVERYYITARPDVLSHPLLPAKYHGRVIAFGSRQHQILYLAAEKILAAFVDAPGCLDPIPPELREALGDLFQAEIIYLQHGVLHAHIPWRYGLASPVFPADRIVISSEFEGRNLTGTYHFSPDQLIPTGMPRYDVIPRNRRPAGKILLAPSWRAYVEDVTHSDFWQGLVALLQSPELQAFLAQQKLTLEVKLHPMLKDYGEKLAGLGDRVRLCEAAVHPEEYQAVITDYSSYVFDFVWLSCPVVYYLPDRGAFWMGQYQYRSLDLPLEQGFGEVCTRPEEVITALERIAANGYAPDPIYQKRMDAFFLPLGNCRQKLYQMLSDTTNTTGMR